MPVAMNDRNRPRRRPGANQSRREFLNTSLLATAAAATGPWPLTLSGAERSDGAPRVAVIGAGVFGGWTALHLLRRGASVTLVDAWGPGNARASSGGETRVIRGMYGSDAIYVDWVVRSFELWKEAESSWEYPLYTPTGALWMFRGSDAYARSSLPLLEERGLPANRLAPEDAARRFPAIDFGGVNAIYHEERAGFIAARDACARLAEAFAAAGGRYRAARAEPGDIANGALGGVALSDGSTLEADHYVFACGPWLGRLFPELLGGALNPTRQEVYYFGTPPGSEAFSPENFPVWIDFGERVFYGIPGNRGHGFKIADDTRGLSVDPTDMERAPSPDGVRRARQLLGERFPALADAPLLESRVCQYTNSPDGHFVLDRHPEADNLWLAGGGSGHGFKLGPAVGEHLADRILGRAEPIDMFSVGRLSESGKQRSQLSGD
jgi:glycine/D-amino acid oxidase-like deaminating enzyme